MTRVFRKFGLSFYVTLVVSLLVLLVAYGKLGVWPRVEAFWKVRTLDREWRDSSLSKASREATAAQLVEFGPAAVPSFLAVGNNLDDPLRSTAYVYLARIKPPPREAIADCVKVLKTDKDPQVRLSAVDLLGSIAIPGGAGTAEQRQEIVESLLAGGSDSSPLVRAAVMHALVYAKDTRPDLTAWLKDDAREVRLAAAEAILQIDPTKKDRIVPAFRTIVDNITSAKDDDMWLSREVLRIDPEANKDLVSTFTSWLHNDDPGVRIRVAWLLGSLGPQARDALPILETHFASGQPRERISMAWAILEIDPTAVNRVLPAINSLINDPAVDRENKLEATRLARRYTLKGLPAGASTKSSPKKG